MLKKLLKYDLQSMFKFLIIFYGLSLFFGILARIFLSIEDSFIMYIIGQVCSGATVSMMFSIVINNLMRLWIRFKQNLYGDESYLTHTLPIEKKTLYLSKIITAFITLFTSITVVCLTLFTAYYSKESMDTINVIKVLLALLLMLFLEFANALQCGFCGIIIGHRKNNAKTGLSVLFGFISFIFSQMFVLLIVFAFSVFDKDLMNLFFTNEMINTSSMKAVLYISAAAYISVLTVGYFINIKLFKKGVNVD